MKTTITVNGVARAADLEPRALLVQFLRDEMGLTGTHIGCETSQCGACTVLLNGDPVKSCSILAAQVDGAEVMTIEGLAPAGHLHPIQAAFWEKNGVQCGYCTSGMVLSVAALLNEQPNPSEHEIREALEGNICRCTGYQGIVDSVQLAAERIAAGAVSQLIAKS